VKQLLTANVREDSKRYSFEKVDVLLKAQIENILDAGWKAEDIILVSNVEYKFMGVEAVVTKLNDSCLTGSKMFSIEFALDNGLGGDSIYWARDLDVWPNTYFEEPEIKDVGIATYSSTKLNGGSVFWRPSAIDIVKHVIEEINKGEEKEEPTLNKLLKSKQYAHRTTVLNTTYNVGCSGFFVRAYMAEKPIKVCHLNPLNRIAWETHRLNRDGMGLISVSGRLEAVLRKHFKLADKLRSEKDEKRSLELREKHLAKLERGDYQKRKKAKVI
jgi:hypothetical protein